MSGIFYLKKFDKRQLFRFFVDGRLHSKYRGWIGYDQMEPGSVQAMMNGFTYMLDNFDISTGLKSGYILELHKQCTFNVITSNQKSSPGELRYLNSGMPFFKKTTTLEHLEEVLQLRYDDDTIVFNTKKFAKLSSQLDADELYEFLQLEDKLNYKPWYPNLTKDMQKALNHEYDLVDFYEVKSYIQKKFASKIDKIVNSFNVEMKTSITDYEKIMAMSRITRDLEMLHPFPDGNCRTFANVLLNHLLLFYGFPPAILINPNLDGECSYTQFTDVIIEGIKNTKYLLQNPDASLYNFSISALSDEENNKFLEISKNFVTKLENLKEIYITPKKLTAITNGKWINYNENTRFSGIGSHTTVIQGGLYFCFTKDWIKGKKDVREEMIKASRKGAVAFIIDDSRYIGSTLKPTLLVDDCEVQMKNIAASIRNEVDCKAVLVTGTVGKTGFKFQLHHCLNKQTKLHAFLNSINTKIPVLRTLSSLEKDDKVEIVELSIGASHKDAIERSKIINPDICVFTDIDQNHMHIHKTIDTLVKAKSSAIAGLKDNGICIINSESSLYKEMLTTIKKMKPNINIITFGKSSDDNAKLINAVFDSTNFLWRIEADIDGKHIMYDLPIFHNHAPIQSLGILLTVKYLGFDVSKAASDYMNSFDSFSSIGRIFELSFSSKKVLFYDQSYRGAIKGMRSAFQDIENMNLNKRKIFVLGGTSVKEDNEFTKDQHLEIAKMINDCGVDILYTTGPYMKYVHDNLIDKSILVEHSDNFDVLEKNLKNELQDGDFLFIMGSGDLYMGKLGAKVLKFGTSKTLR